ncbi:biotin-independent malonate decarboxylase subunit gamma [Pseudomonas typographi]|uniref:Biotin-independent malonate decarboxylase subunit gamma n=1 Tax=Pseudomonas typographi TaxID=2715964 RepID=A0ABR7YZ06_9PSED|nr:biotin-independent malonate decarboxylase subunit gamma [Pseudomonas typographi]MBD1550054.1 biotin-independent malonate decarboxylase subunit gamma [Pseudomonas typographi]MBD1585436.1 biotin-independent malonate decarboxylase subunit gamma [Pseudomonas typographi]MBD1598451.1 biotin-independent malonate decarboxylase subunit gamma [Pseudomonas typographi]
MKLDEILQSLFPAGYSATPRQGLLSGSGKRGNGTDVHILGVIDDTPLGIEDAAQLASQVLDIARTPGDAPILLVIDSSSQRMSRHDELLGLNEYLSHLAKALFVAELHGHRSIGLLYGHTAAGAFIATALAATVLVGLPGATPEVMDLPSVSRVTKLSIDVLKEKAKTNPVFAPGLDYLFPTGAVHQIWDPAKPLAEQLETVLSQWPAEDTRAQLGLARGGRPAAQRIIDQVLALAGQ